MPKHSDKPTTYLVTEGFMHVTNATGSNPNSMRLCPRTLLPGDTLTLEKAITYTAKAGSKGCTFVEESARRNKRKTRRFAAGKMILPAVGEGKILPAVEGKD